MTKNLSESWVIVHAFLLKMGKNKLSQKMGIFNSGGSKWPQIVQNYRLIVHAFGQKLPKV